MTHKRIFAVAALAVAAVSSAALAQPPAGAAPGGPPAAGARPPQAPQPPIVFASPEDVAKLLAQSKSERQGNAPNAPYKQVVRAPGGRAQLEYRVGKTNPSIHNTNSELIYVMDGSGTLTIGGTLDGATPAGGNVNGTGITGGTDYALTKGAFAIVPAGQPHGIGTTDPNGLTIFTSFFPVGGAPGAPPMGAAPAAPAAPR
ncbi:MAG: hypothetical protein BGN86_13015 [Caulobacterales bacterium 68-7]|nr:MAG: hypothetical protein BGN86_13015 [Caulobacterales bacterium 68-7]